tara:strand:- start:2619 stop:3179 length:561 start_codon:yes stop_codon:yes gene_type:complete
MNCDANIETIINKQKELIDTIDNYNYYVFCAKVGNTQLIGDGNYVFDKYDSDEEEANSVHTAGTYKLYNEWPQSLIDISNNLETGCRNSALLGLTPTSIITKINSLQTEIIKLEHSDCSDKIQEIRDKHIELMNKKQQVLNLTAQYESDPSSMLKQSELQLDSTIYASILWSTVAAGLLYYVFVDI